MSVGEPPPRPPSLPPRPRHGHKGTFGTVVVVGGSMRSDAVMLGAPALAARAALRSGAGLCRVLAPAQALPHIITLAPSATGVPLPTDDSGELVSHRCAEVLDGALVGADALVIGPGLGLTQGSAALSLRAVQQEDAPVVVDADAINCLAEVPELLRDFRSAAVLTPHPGEFRRIADALAITADPVDPASRPRAAEALAQRLGCIVALKGAGTIVTDGQTTWTCPHGDPCLATAGTGDVLAGLIGGLAAQFVRLGRGAGGLSLFDAARVGVLSHALAGETWSRSHAASAGLLALELADLLPGVLEPMRGGR